jgi:hypothetical protein
MTKRTVLFGARLIDARLTNAYLAGVNFTETDLSGADLADADLTRANLTKANLAGASWNKATTWPEASASWIAERSDDIRPGHYRIRGRQGADLLTG